MDDDAVNSACDDVVLRFVWLHRSSIDVVAEVEVEAGLQWSGMKWRVVENTSWFGARGVGGKDKLVECMTYCGMRGEQEQTALVQKSEGKKYSVDGLEEQCGSTLGSTS